MRLEPSDKPMYHRMDQRDRALIMIPVFGIAASLGLFFLAARFPAIIGGPFIGLGVCGMFGGAIRYWKLKQMIMPLRGCCLEIQTSCFVARQPWKKEHYEQCRIYFKEVQALGRPKQVVFIYRFQKAVRVKSVGLEKTGGVFSMSAHLVTRRIRCRPCTRP